MTMVPIPAAAGRHLRIEIPRNASTCLRIACSVGSLSMELAPKKPWQCRVRDSTFAASVERNPLHSHPNCEEFLYVLSGSCEHKLGEETVMLQPGDTIRIPRDVRHWARAVGDEPVLALIMFSTGKRQAVDHEGGGVA